ncbi:hypothetical protein HDU93_003288, partial [Gonapodya sp. JEL0774]
MSAVFARGLFELWRSSSNTPTPPPPGMGTARIRLESSLRSLNESFRSTGKNDSSKGYVSDPKSLAEDIEVFWKEVPDSDLGVASAILLDKAEGALKFVDATRGGQADTNKILLHVVEIHVRRAGSIVSDYVKYIKDTCWVLYNVDQNNKIKTGCLDVLSALIETDGLVTDPKYLGLSDVFERLTNQFVTLNKKLGVTVKVSLLTLLSNIARYHGSVVQSRKLVQLLTWVCQTADELKGKDDASEKMQAGALNCNRDLRKAAQPAFDEYINQMVIVMNDPSADRKRLKICLKFLASNLLTALREPMQNDSKEVDTRYVAFCVRSFGALARPLKGMDGVRINDILLHLDRAVSLFYSDPTQVSDDAVQYLGSYLQAFAHVIVELDQADIPGSSTIERLSGALFLNFYRLGPRVRYAATLAFQEVLFAFYKKNLLRTFWPNIASRVLILTCTDIVATRDAADDGQDLSMTTAETKIDKPADPADDPTFDPALANLIADDSNGDSEPILEESTDTDSEPQTRSSIVFMTFWKSLFSDVLMKRMSNSPEELQLWEDFFESVYDLAVQVIITFPERLDFTTFVLELTDEGITERVNRTTLPPTGDPASLQPLQPKDFSLFLNYVEFCSRFLGEVRDFQFKRWLSQAGESWGDMSSKFPLVSGFYKLLALCMEICTRHGVFEDMVEDGVFDHDSDRVSREVTGRTDSITKTAYAQYSRILMNVLGRIKLFQGDLLAACLRFVLQTPTELLTLATIAEPLISAFHLGLTHPEMANLGVECLERCTNRFPASHIRGMLKMVLPSLYPYLATDSHIFEFDVTGSKPENRSTSASKNPSRTRESSKWAQNGSNETDSTLKLLQRRIASFLGALGGDSQLVMPENQYSTDTSLLAWDTDRKLNYFIPFPTMKVLINYDEMLPRIVKLAEESPERKTKVAACELLHAMILHMIGISAHSVKDATAEGSKGRLSSYYQKLLPVILRLAVDTDAVTRALFRPLMTEMIHWFTNNQKFESSDTVIMLNACIEAVSGRGQLREFGGECLAEFLRWSIKRTAQDSEVINAKSLFLRLFLLCKDQSPFKRLGAGMKNLVRNKRERAQPQFETTYVNYTETARLAKDALRHCEKIILKAKSEFLDDSGDRRTIHELGERVDLGSLVEWLFKGFGSKEREFSRACMQFALSFVPLLKNGPKLRDWIGNGMVTDSHLVVKVLEAEQSSMLEWLIVSAEGYGFLLFHDALLSRDFARDGSSLFFERCESFLNACLGRGDSDDGGVWRDDISFHKVKGNPGSKGIALSAVLRLALILARKLPQASEHEMARILLYRGPLFAVLARCILEPDAIYFGGETKDSRDSAKHLIRELLPVLRHRFPNGMNYFFVAARNILQSQRVWELQVSPLNVLDMAFAFERIGLLQSLDLAEETILKVVDVGKLASVLLEKVQSLRMQLDPSYVRLGNAIFTYSNVISREFASNLDRYTADAELQNAWSSVFFLNIMCSALDHIMALPLSAKSIAASKFFQDFSRDPPFYKSLHFRIDRPSLDFMRKFLNLNQKMVKQHLSSEFGRFLVNRVLTFFESDVPMGYKADALELGFVSISAAVTKLVDSLDIRRNDFDSLPLEKQTHANDWVPVLMRMVVDSERFGQGINYYVVDLYVTEASRSRIDLKRNAFFFRCILVLSWSISRAVPDDKTVVNDFLHFLVQNVYVPNETQITKTNVKIVQEFVELWKTSLFLPSADLTRYIENDPSCVTGITLLNAFLANGVVPSMDKETISSPNSNSKERLFQLLCEKLKAASKREYLSAAYIADVHQDKNQRYRYLMLLYHVSREYLPIAQEHSSTVLFMFPSLNRGEDKALALQILARSPDSENIFGALKSRFLMSSLIHRDDMVQAAALGVLLQFVGEFDEVTLQQMLPQIAGIFTDHPSTTCRTAFYGLVNAIAERDRFSDPIKLQLRAILLRGLTDPSTKLRSSVTAYWNTFLRREVPGALAQITKQVATYLLLGLAAFSREYEDPLFKDGLPNATFHEWSMVVGSAAQSSLQPLFAPSQSQTNVRFLPIAGVRDSQAVPLAFTPTIDLARQSLEAMSNSLTNSSLGGAMGPQVMTSIPRKQQTQLQRESEFSSLRRRFEKRGRLKDEQAFARRAGIRKSVDLRRQVLEKDIRERGVNLTRRYRFGDLPDISIPNSHLLLPLQTLATLDTGIASHVFLQIVIGVCKEVENEFTNDEATNFKNQLAGALEFILRTCVHPPVVASVTRVMLEIQALRSPVNLVASSNRDAITYDIGIVTAEAIMMEGVSVQPSTKRARSNTEGRRTGVADWLHVASLYRRMGDLDIVRATAESKLASPGSSYQKSVDAEIAGNLEGAFESLKEQFQSLSESTEEFQRRFLVENFMDVCMRLGEWKVLATFTEDVEDIWEDSNKDVYLKYYIRSHLRNKGDERASENFSKFLDDALTDENKRDFLGQFYPSDLAETYITAGDSLRGRFYSQQALDGFLRHFAQLHPSAVLPRRNLLGQLQRVREAFEFLDFEDDLKMKSDVQNLSLLNGKLAAWKTRFPLESDSIESWDSVIGARIRYLETLDVRSLGVMDVDPNFNGQPVETLTTTAVDISTMKRDFYVQEAEAALLGNAFQWGHDLLKVARSLGHDRIENTMQRVKLNLQRVLNQTQNMDSSDIAQSRASAVVALLELLGRAKNDLSSQRNQTVMMQVLMTEAECYDALVDPLVNPDSLTVAFTGYRNAAEKVDARQGGILANIPNSSDEFASLIQTNEFNSLYQSVNVASTEPSQIVERDLDVYKERHRYANILMDKVFVGMAQSREEAIGRFPRLLQLLELYDIDVAFEHRARTVPSWTYLRWIPQLAARLGQTVGLRVFGILEK